MGGGALKGLGPCLGLALWILGLPGLAVAQALIEEPVADEHSEEVQAVLEALEAADLVPEPATVVRQPAGQALGPSHWILEMDTRLALAGGQPVDLVSRWKAGTSGLWCRGRLRRGTEKQRLNVFCVGAQIKGLSLRAGGVGLTSALGLLLAGPGRTAGLMAGQSFLVPRTRMHTWAAAPDSRSSLGVAASLSLGPWQMAALVGGSENGSGRIPVKALVLNRKWNRLELGSSVVSRQDQEGVSGSLFWKQKNSHCAVEGILWRTPGWDGLYAAWLATVRFRLIPAVLLEGQMAGSNSSDGISTGRRPAVLATWGGSGWAIRMTWRLKAGWSLKTVLAMNRGAHWQGNHQQQSGVFQDWLLAGRLPGGWSVSGRWHRRVRRSDGWSDPYPWLPASLQSQDKRAGLALDLKKVLDGVSWGVSLRSLDRQGSATSGRRTLLAFKQRRPWGRWFRWRLSYQTAWGDPVDLVSAIAPIQGLILPRHWGKWSSEILLGLETVFPRVRLQAAASRREPSAGNGEPARIMAWLNLQLRW